LAKEQLKVALTSGAKCSVLEPVIGEVDPIMRNAQPLSHDTAIRAMLAETLIHIDGSCLGNKSEDVADFVHGHGFDALKLQRWFQFQKT